MSALPASTELHSPASLEEALGLMAHGGRRPLAGGTDFFASLSQRPFRNPLVDLQGIAALRGIHFARSPEGAETLRIGALTTWSDLRATPLPAGLEALALAAAEVGGRQVQNRGTLGGNLCNASPAADGVPVLLALDASVALQSSGGTRQLPLASFILGNRRTALAPDELLVGIDIPLPTSRARSTFLKLGHRRFLVISVTMISVRIDVDDSGRIQRCAIAVGACSEVAQRLPALERRLVGCTVASAAACAAQLLIEEKDRMLEVLAPIDDVRGTARYRRDALCTLIPRALAAQ
ncbi:MAG: FAD binding domain-containing protein [Betaproteobacteria bacterium]